MPADGLPAAPFDPAMTRRADILIVEDDEYLRLTLRHTLRLAGFDTREARSGMEALAMLDRGRPDAVVLDIILPGIDGLAVYDEIRAHSGTRDLPVIIITGSSLPLEQLSAACVLRKPFAPDDLVRAVAECLKSGER